MPLNSLFLLFLARTNIFPELSKKAFKAFSLRNLNRRELVKTTMGFRMELAGADVVENRIWVYKEFEPGLTHVLRSISQNASIAIDVGCNVGYFSCLMKKCNKDLRLFCIDPNPAVLKKCLNNLQLNAYDATMIQCAIGDNSGVQTLLVPVNNPCLATLGSSVKVREEIVRIPVTVRRLEDIVAENNIEAVDILKMDTEGYDIKILQSLNKEFVMNIKNIICEFSEVRLRQCSSNMGDLFQIPWLNLFQMNAILDDGNCQEIKYLSEWPVGKSETLWLRNFRSM